MSVLLPPVSAHREVYSVARMRGCHLRLGRTAAGGTQHPPEGVWVARPGGPLLAPGAMWSVLAALLCRACWYPLVSPARLLSLPGMRPPAARVGVQRARCGPALASDRPGGQS